MSEVPAVDFLQLLTHLAPNQIGYFFLPLFFCQSEFPLLR